MSNTTEITIDVIIHATEDIKKFYEAFEELFGIKEQQFTEQTLAGHYDNPIVVLHARITKKKDDSDDHVQKIIGRITSGVSSDQKEEIAGSLDKRIDDTSLYIRLDKQKFVQGQIVLDEKNAIKLRIYTPIYKKKEILLVYKALLGFD